MKAFEGSGKRCRRLIPILDSNINYPSGVLLQFYCRKGQSAPPYVFAQCHIRHIKEHLLEIVGRATSHFCHFFIIQFLCNMLLYVFN